MKHTLIEQGLFSLLQYGSSENEDNEQNKDVTCPCENDDVGLKYICDSLTNDVESCMLHVAKSLRHIYGNNANEPFKRLIVISDFFRIFPGLLFF
jgi:hypothetical protein